MEMLLAEIRDQTGDVVDLSEAKVPAKYKAKHIRYGSNSAIHTLRVYACRLAGYTLDEAYELPERVISVLGTSELEDADEEEESGFEVHGERSGEFTEEQEIERAWHFDLDLICPMPSGPMKPFPFPHLVCFSDTEGIYIPKAFREPIVLDDYFIGSSVQLNAELSEVAQQLTTRTITVVNQETNVLEFLAVVKGLLVALRNPCLISVRHRISMLFG